MPCPNIYIYIYIYIIYHNMMWLTWSRQQQIQITEIKTQTNERKTIYKLIMKRRTWSRPQVFSVWIWRHSKRLIRLVSSHSATYSLLELHNQKPFYPLQYEEQKATRSLQNSRSKDQNLSVQLRNKYIKNLIYKSVPTTESAGGQSSASNSSV